MSAARKPHQPSNAEAKPLHEIAIAFEPPKLAD
jgi:hypothetical protein